MKQNIILVGFMGSGKSTVGRELAKSLDMKFIDTDHYIERKENMRVKEIFAKKGEKYFREIETKYIKEISLLNHTVISTGGNGSGTVMDFLSIEAAQKMVKKMGSKK